LRRLFHTIELGMVPVMLLLLMTLQGKNIINQSISRSVDQWQEKNEEKRREETNKPCMLTRFPSDSGRVPRILLLAKKLCAFSQRVSLKGPQRRGKGKRRIERRRRKTNS